MQESSSSHSTGPQPEAKLVFRQGYHKGRVEFLRRDRVTVGRNRSNDIVIDMGRVISSFHAAFVRNPSDGSWWIEDLKSKNGTFVNGKRTERKCLQEGDMISFAGQDIKLLFTYGESQETGEFLETTIAGQLAVPGAVPPQCKESRRGRRLLVVGALAVLCAAGIAFFAFRSAGTPAGDLPVKLTVSLDPLYGSLFLSYRERPIGKAEVANTGTRALKGVSLTLSFLGEASDFLVVPFHAERETLPGRAQWEVPLLPRLSHAVLCPVTREVACRVVVRAGSKMLAERQVPLFVHGRNVFNWKEPEGIAAFVDPQDPLLTHLIHLVWQRSPQWPQRGFPPERFRAAVRIVTALAQLGLRYLPDAETPVSQKVDQRARDRVNYPWETLLSKNGDCDDLSVLCAAALEAVGIPTAVVICPRHVLVMFESGLEVSSLGTVPLESTSVIPWEKRLWVPIETTVFGRPEAGFTRAWAEGWSKRPLVLSREAEVVQIRKAWQKYQPMAPELNAQARKLLEDTSFVPPDLGDRIAEAMGALKRYFLANVKKGAAQIGAAYPQGPQRDRALGAYYTHCGLYDHARELFFRSLFRTTPSSQEELLRKLSSVPASPENALLLGDLATCITLSARGELDLTLAGKLYEEAFKRSPAGGIGPERGECALRVALVHRLRGDLAGEKVWCRKAFSLAPSLKDTYRRLTAAHAARAGLNEEIRSFLVRALR